MRITKRAVTPPTPTDTDPDFASLFAAEDRHFWFRARNRVLGELLRTITASMPAGYRVLEVGCGNGNVLRVLEHVCDRGTVIGVDVVKERLRLARHRVRCQLIQADINNWPFRTPFDVIGLFDVLEHLSDDRRLLRQLYHGLAPGGHLVLTVPAHRHLWSYSDVYAKHYRRYAPKELEEALGESGFAVEYLSPFMGVLYPLMWLGRRLAAWGQPTGAQCPVREMFHRELRIIPVFNDLLSWLLGMEAQRIARRERLPLGTSLLAVARREGR